MPRKGENIYKRKDGRWEGRYKRGKIKKEKQLMDMCMRKPIKMYEKN